MTACNQPEQPNEPNAQGWLGENRFPNDGPTTREMVLSPLTFEQVMWMLSGRLAGDEDI